MFEFLYKIYFHSFKSKRLDSLYYRIIIRMTNVLLPIWFAISSKSIKHKILKPGDELFIVSLTTFPARIDKVWLTIESILRQDEKPNKIILWLYNGEFNGKDSLPKNLLRLEKRGLEIYFCKENLMPHKKYFYTMLQYPEANIITIDDDMFYPFNLISKLKKSHKEYPEAIICPITRQIEVKGNEIQPYNDSNYLRFNSIPNFKNHTMGGGGAFFPAHSLHIELFNLEILKKYALTADDLWLKVMSLKNGTKVVSIAGEYPGFFIPIIQNDNKKLADSNLREGQNDIVFKELIRYYEIPMSIFNG